MEMKMNENIDRAIGVLASLIQPAIHPDHAIKYTQAALNLAQVKGALTLEKRDQVDLGAMVEETKRRRDALNIETFEGGLKP